MLDGDEGADADIGEAFDGLNDDLDVFPLLAGGGEEGQVAELGEHAAELRLEQHDDGTAKNAENAPENPLQHLQLQEGRSPAPASGAPRGIP